MTTRVGLFSDIHGNQYAWRAFLQQLPALQLDELIFCGDIFGYYYGQTEILAGLAELKNLTWLAGNHERFFWEVKDGLRDPASLIPAYGSGFLLHADMQSPILDRLRGLPFFATLEREGLSIWAGHGTPANPADGRLYPKDLTDHWPEIPATADVVVMGHTHFRLHRRIGRTLLINPGSLGQPRDKKPAGLAIVTLPDLIVEFIDLDYDRRALGAEIRLHDPGHEKLLELLYRSPARCEGGQVYDHA